MLTSAQTVIKETLFVSRTEKKDYLNEFFSRTIWMIYLELNTYLFYVHIIYHIYYKIKSENNINY